MRFEGDYEEEFPGQHWLWEGNLQRHFSGRAGQAKLRELRDALLELPEKRLIETRLADEKGNVCALGALSLKHRVDAGEPREQVLEMLARRIRPDERWGDIDGWDAEEATRAEAEAVGCKLPFITTVAWENDFGPSMKETPEERYSRVLAWVEKRIVHA